MKIVLTFCIFITLFPVVRAQTRDCSTVLNHLLITVDSTTYQAILGSEILTSDFAYAYERDQNWQGIYLIGQDNYIEIFHPNSVSGEIIPIGFSWICQSSLVANCLEGYQIPNNLQITYASDENFVELTFYTKDTVYSNSAGLITTQEMKKHQYETWTKKSWNDSLKFQPTDYNSPAESDSSKNYLFNGITGIQINLNTNDSLSITQYLQFIGYSLESQVENKLKFSNSIDFIELNFSEKVEFATIAVIHFKLNRPTELKYICLGNSEIVLEGNHGKWELNKEG